MDWNAFLEKTRVAAKAESFAKLAPLIGVTDGAVSHYRVGRSVPQVWVVAECLRIQGHPEPEKAAIAIMKSEARTSTERRFYKNLLATASLLLIAVVPVLNSAAAYTHAGALNSPQAMHYAKSTMVGTPAPQAPPPPR